MSACKVGDAVIVWGFVVCCATLGIVSLVLPPDQTSFAREGRAPASFPTGGRISDLRRFPNRFEAFFQDRLAFRKTLLNAHAAIKVRGLGVSSSNKVIVGEEGWLFLDPQSESDGAVPVSSEVRALRWADSLRLWKAWCDRRGLRYLFVLVPEKQTIYPDQLPASLRPPQPAQAVEHLRQLGPSVLGEAFLDLKPMLERFSGPPTLYFRTDTHWNDDGASIGYREIVKRLGLEPIAEGELARESHQAFVGDLARMLHLSQPEPEMIQTLHHRQPRARRRDESVPLNPQLHSPPTIPPQVWGVSDRGLPRGAMFHDSFAERLLIPLLAEHFETLVYAPAIAPDPDVIEPFHAQIVIQQLVERRINHHDPVGPP